MIETLVGLVILSSVPLLFWAVGYVWCGVEQKHEMCKRAVTPALDHMVQGVGLLGFVTAVIGATVLLVFIAHTLGSWILS